MQLKESGQMYLETIYILTKQKGVVRSVDIGEYMGYSKPSISRAVSILKKYGYIFVDSESHIIFTDKGYKEAKKMCERHTVLTKFLKILGVEEKVAAKDACKIEHDISEATFKVIKKYVKENKDRPD